MTGGPTRALVLTGGGARGAYQAGVVRGLAAMAATRGRPVPFEILSGTSAGAINATYLGAHADDWDAASKRLAELWTALRTDEVYRTDVASILWIAGGWLVDIFTGGAMRRSHPRALLDTGPLRQLIARNINFDTLAANVTSGLITAVTTSATDYGSNTNVTFFAAPAQRAAWERTRRIGVPMALRPEHVMASAAIPLFFPPVAVGHRYFGDGSLRNAAPLSPALHLGADRLLVISVRRGSDATLATLDVPAPKPGIARILSLMINAVLLDAVDTDLERLTRINRTVTMLTEAARSESDLRSIDCLHIRPSADIAQIALEEAPHLPKLMRFLLGGLGSRSDGAELISHLMFEPAYTRRLVELGMRDAAAHRDELMEFMRD